MAIIDHPKHQYSVPGLTYYESAKVVQCDFCRDLAKKSATNPGDASEQARSVGFQTVPGPNLGDPKMWACPKCVKNPNRKPVVLRDYS